MPVKCLFSITPPAWSLSRLSTSASNISIWLFSSSTVAFNQL